MLAELGVVLADPSHRLTDRTGHTDSRTLGCGCGPSIATTEANRARQLSHEEIAFGVGLRGPLRVPEGARLLDVILDVGETPAVRVLGLLVEHLTGVADCRVRQLGRTAALDLRNGARLGGYEVQHVDLPAGGREQPPR
jgi:hypothetical protein